MSSRVEFGELVQQENRFNDSGRDWALAIMSDGDRLPRHAVALRRKRIVESARRFPRGVQQAFEIVFVVRDHYQRRVFFVLAASVLTRPVVVRIVRRHRVAGDDSSKRVLVHLLSNSAPATPAWAFAGFPWIGSSEGASFCPLTLSACSPTDIRMVSSVLLKKRW